MLLHHINITLFAEKTMPKRTKSKMITGINSRIFVSMENKKPGVDIIN